ncbi:MAG: protein-disulfide reductase DsbD N-terminal domain-containing protein [Acidobacteriota bacterium]|nr:protein-disulfide reductase DsbD N-terminal domain-containing protein [Acidobacteriota bacterium]
MAGLKKHGFAFAAAILGLAAVAAQGQIFGGNAQDRSIAKVDAVAYLFPEQVTVPAGKASQVALHFRIAPGLHINSHAPKEDYLIPTTFSIPAGSGARLEAASYPPGTDVTLPVDPKTKLNVYTGEFIIQARVVAARGNHLVQGKLHYQACNNTQCMPPKTVTVAIDVIGK